jgi:hypothetical protein
MPRDWIKSSLREYGKDKRQQQQAAENEGKHATNHETNRSLLNASNISYQADNHKDEAEQYSYQMRQLNVAIGLNMITLLAAIAGLFGLYILYGTLQATRNAANATRAEVVVSERAWIIPQINFQLPNETTQMTPIDIRVTLTNTGKTPAKHIFAEVYAEVLDKGSAPNFSYQGPHIMYILGLLFPQDSHSFDSGPYNAKVEPLSLSDYERLKGGKAYMVAYARSVYVDVFGVPRWVQRCAWLVMALGDYASSACAQYDNIDNN